MGEKSCVHILFGAYSRPAALISVSGLFPCNLCVSTLPLVKYLEVKLAMFLHFGFHSNYGVPLHLIRELYETFRNFKLRIADYVRYRKITSNMNDRFPDATPEELNTLVFTIDKTLDCSCKSVVYLSHMFYLL